MKFRTLAPILATAALLPAFAQADEYGDSIRASFSRDLGHEPVATYYAPVAEADPLDVIDAMLRGEKMTGLTQTIIGSND